MKRPCLDCGMPTDGSRCSLHRKLTMRRRQSATSRGYDRHHRAARAALRDTLPAPCAYGCGTWLEPDGVWNAAHVIDGDASAGWIAACVSCNQRARARRGRG
jgi:hypothetical protein